MGAGVVGASVAHELARRGRRVVVLDRGPGAGTGSTSASSAIVRFNYSTWTGVAASWESKHLWESWEGFLGGTDDGALARFHRTGGVCLDAPELPTDLVLNLFDQVGVPYERWSPQELVQHLPHLDPGRHHPPRRIEDEEFWAEARGSLGAYFMPDAGFVDDPAFAAHNLMAAAVRHGAEFRFRQEVVAVERDGAAVAGLRLADGRSVRAPVVVNAAGPHSAVLNTLAGVLDDFAVGTRPLRQEVHQLPHPGGGTDPLPFVADLDLGVYFRSTPSGRLMVGGTEPACDPLEWLDDPDVLVDHVTPKVYEAQTYRAARRLPDLTVPPTPHGIVGVYDVSTDWVPIYDRTSLGGYYVAVGTSGNQFKNAPVIGRFLATIIEATEEGRDHDAEPVSCLLDRTGLTVDLGHYSRLRDPASTSGTVLG
ncbi:FAD-binding oxidoreductase [Ornithinimicrobium avium]|uniref:FAD-binding oxidoreductase n=1 Tax=Ornithinimicrobium avium TaxID=2283195 RepID=A0A345NSB6_9MICO|nr:FAD-binding oxidoreductase [Ornithinimicrobium avium]